jgi:flagellar M-ring protein FliF
MGLGAQFQDQINNVWQNFSKRQKATILIIVLLFFVIVIGLIFVNQPKMEVLYSGLSPENAQALTAKLKEMKVPYQLADEGKTILVRAEDKYQLRLDMASQVNLTGVTIILEWLLKNLPVPKENQRKHCANYRYITVLSSVSAI